VTTEIEHLMDRLQALDWLIKATVAERDYYKHKFTFAVEGLRGSLQAALTPLEAAADALAPPGARVEEAAALVEEALVVIREELE